MMWHGLPALRSPAAAAREGASDLCRRRRPAWMGGATVVGACFLLGLWAGRAAAQITEDPEYRFAKGLAGLGYADLAAERYEAVKAGAKPEDPGYATLVRDLVEALFGAADQAQAPDERVALSGRAMQEMRALVASRPAGDERNDLSLELGRAALRRGQVLSDLLARRAQGLDEQALVAEAQADFDAAVEALRQASEAYAAIVKEIEAKAATGLDNRDRIRRAQALEKQVVADTELGWARLRLAQFWALKGDDARRAAALESAVKVFGEVAAAHADKVAGGYALLGKGVALEEQGKADEALAAYDALLAMPLDEATAPLHQQGLLRKGEALRAGGKFRPALEAFGALEGLLQKFPRASNVNAETLALAKAKTLGAYADALSAEAAKIQATDAAKARALQAESTQAYQQAIRTVEPVTRNQTSAAREAFQLMGDWLARSGGRVQRSAREWFALGEARLAEGDPLAAAEAYRQALAMSGPAEDDLQRNAWLRMGLAYARAGKDAPEYFFHGGLVLQHAARLYPDAPFAERSAVHGAALLGANYANEGRTTVDTDAYLDAQSYLIERWPHNEAALRAAYRLAGQLRGRGEFLKAAAAFENVQESSPFYEAAQFNAGDTYWEAYVRSRERERADRTLADRAVERLTAFISWAQTAPSPGGEAARTRTEYAGRARVRLAEIYLDDDLAAPDKALALLEGFEERYRTIPGLPPQGLFQRVRAHCALQRLDEAERDLERLLAFRDYEHNALACRIVGSAFVEAASALRASGAAADSVAAANAKAGKYLTQSLALKPEQPLDEYVLIARLLYQAEAFEGAARAFEHIVAEFKDHEDVVWSAKEWLATCRMETGEWPLAVEGFTELVANFPQVMSVRRKLALSLEHLETAEARTKAVEEWRTVLRTVKQGSPEWFEARYHLARDHALLGKKDVAYELVATTAISYPALGGAEWRGRFEALVRDLLPESRTKFEELLKAAAPAP